MGYLRKTGVLKQETVCVNSFHYQSINKLGHGLKVIAKSEDGIIEAVEYTNHHFALGVQFHPEFMAKTDQLMNEIFVQFIESPKSSFIKR